MNIEFEEKDLKYIDNINKDLESGEEPPLLINKIDHQYYIAFTCKDIAKSNGFIMGLIKNPQFNSVELEEKFGIVIDSINFSKGDLKIKELKNTLQNFIDELDKI